jgi:hypothetical protein
MERLSSAARLSAGRNNLAAMLRRLSHSQEQAMKQILFACVTALAVATQALAQTTPIDLSAEDRAKIKDYVVKQNLAPSPFKERVKIGVTLPVTVSMRPVPSDWGRPLVRLYYLYSNNKVVLVDPKSRKVVEIID